MNEQEALTLLKEVEAVSIPWSSVVCLDEDEGEKYEALSEYLERHGFLDICGEDPDGGFYIELNHSIDETLYRLENGIPAED